MSLVKWLLVTVTVLAAAAMLLTGTAVAQQASLPDIEDEVMCPTCGVPLNHAFSPQAERQREFIRAEIDRGRDKGQIKQALVAEFGPEVLAEPDAGERGFDIVAFLVPALVVLAGIVAIWISLSRWRRRDRTVAEPAAELNAGDSERLRRDISRYDL